MNRKRIVMGGIRLLKRNTEYRIQLSKENVASATYLGESEVKGWVSSHVFRSPKDYILIRSDSIQIDGEVVISNHPVYVENREVASALNLKSSLRQLIKNVGEQI